MYLEKDKQESIFLIESKEEDSENIYCSTPNRPYENTKLVIAMEQRVICVYSSTNEILRIMMSSEMTSQDWYIKNMIGTPRYSNAYSQRRQRSADIVSR